MSPRVQGCKASSRTRTEQGTTEGTRKTAAKTGGRNKGTI
ncbi:HTH myb-type domain-containing protein [Psidium guajava]|nr:HTH myb-type domain-containing protein [Psidium guajava]